MPMRVCVFGSSSRRTSQVHIDAARAFGEVLAKKGYLCVNGGGKFGVMGGLNHGCIENGGKVEGIIHEKFCVDFGEHELITDLIIARGEDLGERKQMLFDAGDCIIVLPGGPGTFDEFFEAVLHKSLGMKGLLPKPICLVNCEGYYDGVVAQMQRASEDGVLYGDPESYFHVERDAESALAWCEREVAGSNSKEGDLAQKKSENRPVQGGSSWKYDPNSRIALRKVKAVDGGVALLLPGGSDNDRVHTAASDSRGFAGFKHLCGDFPFVVFAVGLVTGFMLHSGGIARSKS